MPDKNPNEMPIPDTAKILERKPAQELTVTLLAVEWANILRRVRGSPHSPRLFWMCIGSIEGQLTETKSDAKAPDAQGPDRILEAPRRDCRGEGSDDAQSSVATGA